MINIIDFWEDVKDELSKSMNVYSYEVYIKVLEPVCFFDNSFVLSVMTKSAKKTIEEKYIDFIIDSVKKINSSITNVTLILPEKKEEYIKNQSIFLSDAGIVTSDEKEKKPKKCPFIEKYTFDTFIEGKSNSYTLAACKAVAQNPGTTFNPLFIYSGVGLGKTHLLHAIGNYMYKYSPKKSVLYVSAETMVTELISIFRSKSIEAENKFREKYRVCDVLMVDDIQFLIKREAVQEVFFHIFNDLYQSNKQIIITSDKAVKEFTTLEERLRTRFSWGLTVDIQVPDMETRIAILKNKAGQIQFDLSDAVAEYIAEISTSNIREMEGMLTKIYFLSRLKGHTITTRELAMEALSEVDDSKTNISASDIIDLVCHNYGVNTDELFSKKRTKNLVEPRMVAIFLINDMLGLPLTKIGEIFNGRDHTTIMHARDTIYNRMKTDKVLRLRIADIKNLLLKR